MKWISYSVYVLMILVACGKKVETIKPTVGDLTISVYASGKIKAADQYNVFATVNGILGKAWVHENDLVKKDQILFELEHKAPELNAENAGLAYELSKENGSKNSDKRAELELNANIAKEKFLLDSSLYIRQKMLFSQNIGSELDYQQRTLNYQNSLTNYQTAKSKLAQLKIQLSNEMKRASVNYKLNKKFESDYFIRSHADGKVYELFKEEGELITPQTQLAVLGSKDSFILSLEVDENDILLVKPGQHAYVTMDSYKGQVFDVVIDKIYPMMNERSRTFSVDAHFTHPPQILYPNLSVEANILTVTKKNALLIPINYLVDKTFVLLKGGEKRKVKTGLSDYKQIEILEGLSADDVISKP